MQTTILTEDTATTPAINGSSAMQSSDPRLTQLIYKTASAAAASAVMQALTEADTKIESMMSIVNAKLGAISGVARPIMHIKINDAATRELSSAMHPMLPTLLGMVQAGLQVMLVGPAGCGKSQLAASLAESMGLSFASLCLSAGASETWLFGRQTPNGYQESPLVTAWRSGGIFLLDELDAADANLLMAASVILETSSEFMFNPISGETIKKHPDCFIISAANTFGKGADSLYTARSRLDATTLSRFCALPIDYDSAVEDIICPNLGIANALRALRKAVVDRNGTEIVSYRFFDQAYRLLAVFDSPTKIIETITASWQASMRAECLVAALAAFKATGSAGSATTTGSATGSATGSDETRRGPGRPVGWRKANQQQQAQPMSPIVDGEKDGEKDAFPF